MERARWVLSQPSKLRPERPQNLHSRGLQPLLVRWYCMVLLLVVSWPCTLTSLLVDAHSVGDAASRAADALIDVNVTLGSLKPGARDSNAIKGHDDRAALWPTSCRLASLPGLAC